MPHPLRPRRLRRRPRAAARGGRRGRPRLPGPRHVVDAGRHARARLLLRLRRAARHAHGPRAAAHRGRDRQHVGAAPARPRCCATSARSATRTASRGRSSAARARRCAPRSSSSTRSPPRSPRRRGSPAAIPPSAPSRRIRIAVNDELGQLDLALPLRLGPAARGRAGSPRSRSTRSRTGASSASSPTAPAAASARPTCPCAAAAGRRRPSSCSGAPSCRPRARSPTTRAPSRPACGPRASSPTRRCAHERHRPLRPRRPHRRTVDRTIAPRSTRRVSGPVTRRARRGAGRRRDRRGARPAFARVRALPDSRWLDRALRGRLWIWLLGAALLGVDVACR